MNNISFESQKSKVVVYGYCDSFFKWKTPETHVYHFNALVINHENKLYVVANRELLVNCQSLIMYYSVFDSNNTILSNDLQVAFSLYEFNLAILVSKNCDCLDTSKSKIVHGSTRNKELYGYPFHNLKIPPNKNKNEKYVFSNVNIIKKKKTIIYDIAISQGKFFNTELIQINYTPECLYFIFKLGEIEGTIIHGMSVFDHNNNLFGISMYADDYKIFVLPAIYIYKLFKDYFEFKDKQSEYQGLYTIDADISIESIPLKVFMKDENIYIHNSYFNEDMPLYLHSLINPEEVENCIKLQLFNDFTITLTSRSYFSTGQSIPYIDVKGIIITQFTLELVNTCHFIRYNITNDMIEKFDSNYKMTSENIKEYKKKFIIIDCLNNKMRKKYNLSKLVPKSKIYVPFVSAINDKEISDIDTLKQMDIRKISLTSGIDIIVQ